MACGPLHAQKKIVAHALLRVNACSTLGLNAVGNARDAGLRLSMSCVTAQGRTSGSPPMCRTPALTGSLDLPGVSHVVCSLVMHATQATALAVAWEASRAALPVGNATPASQTNALQTLESAVSRAATRLYHAGASPHTHVVTALTTQGLGGWVTHTTYESANRCRSHKCRRERARIALLAGGGP